MKTKNIFKTVALAMLMPAMLLTSACSNQDDIANTSNITNKGYALPVTVNVTRGDGATRATFDGSKLNFGEGDKLFVEGPDNGGAGQFAGTLTWQSGGTFSGTIYTQNPYTGTAQALLTAAGGGATATLLPNGYQSTGFLSIDNNNTTDIAYDDEASAYFNGAFVASETAKATGVEQLSFEQASTYSSGFALTPRCAILNFTISGLEAGEKTVTLNVVKGTDYTVTGSVTPNAGVATFAIGVPVGANIKDMDNNLTVGTHNFTLPSSTTFAVGKIYNITRSALTYPIALSAVTSSYVGSVVTTDGNVYATVAAASAASKTAVAVIAYVGTAGSVDASSGTYKGLAVALSDANSGSNCKWAESYANCLSSTQTDDIVTALGFKNGITCTSTLTGDGHTHAAATAAASNNGTTAPTGTSGWFMPSMGQWNLIVQGLATKKAGSAVTTDLTYFTVNPTYKAYNLNSVITDAGGTGFQESFYWASTEKAHVPAWAIYFGDGYAIQYAKDTNRYVRSIIAF